MTHFTTHCRYTYIHHFITHSLTVTRSMTHWLYYETMFGSDYLHCNAGMSSHMTRHFLTLVNRLCAANRILYNHNSATMSGCVVFSSSPVILSPGCLSLLRPQASTHLCHLPTTSSVWSADCVSQPGDRSLVFLCLIGWHSWPSGGGWMLKDEHFNGPAPSLYEKRFSTLPSCLSLFLFHLYRRTIF